MPTLKAVQRLHRIKKDGTAEIQIRVSHNRKTIYVRTGYYIKPIHLIEGVIKKHPESTLLNLMIEDKKAEILKSILKQDLLNEPVNIKQAAGKRPESTETMYGAIMHTMKMFEAQKKVASYNRMATNLQYIKDAWEKDKFIKDVVKTDVETYANFRYKLGNSATTVKKNLADLASVLNHVDYQGFNHFSAYAKTIKAKPVKRESLTIEEVELLERIKLKGLHDLARDMFLFSYYAHGSRFESCVLFEKEWIKQENISFIQNKGKKIISIKMHPKLKEIIDKYNQQPGKYLFPLIKKNEIDIWEKKDIVGSCNALINTYLKRVSILCGIEKNISFHVSRHTAASIAYHSGVRSDTIKEILGHTNLRTTEGYLRSLDKDKINDEFNIIY